MTKKDIFIITSIVVLLGLGVAGFLSNRNSERAPETIAAIEPQIDIIEPDIDAPEILTSPDGNLVIETQSPTVTTQTVDIAAITEPATQAQLATFPLGGQQYSFLIAADQNGRTQGLSGVTALPEQNGMIFVFQETIANNGFWMKDMMFAIDMIWLDEAGTIVHIAHEADPESYFASPPKIFYPGAPSRFVIEINAGQAKDLGLAIGQSITLPNSITQLAQL